MKKMFKKLLCIALAVTMTVITPMQSLAAGTNEYVSEIKMATCDSLEEAKEELSGYTVLESDLNAGQGNDAQSVYLGYKTTTDRSEAITDLRLMDMNGGYSYCDYDKALESRQSAIKTEIDSFIDAVKEFQENYKAGKSNAVYAYQQMNMYKDDDTGKLIGDIFLDEAITSDDLTTIFLQGNSASVSAIEQYLAIGCADDWVSRLDENVKKTYGADAYVLEDYCELVRLQWEDFYTGLTKFEEQLESDNPYDMTEYTEESYNAWLETNPSKDTQYYVANYSAAYNILDSYEYKGGTLLDYFMVPLEDVDYEYLYPVADAMTEGQLQTLAFISLYSSVTYTRTDFDNMLPEIQSMHGDFAEMALDYLEENVDSENGVEVTGADSVVSIYEGVDRSLFMKDSGVALTNDALRKMNSSDDASAISQIFNNCKISLSICAAVGAALVIGTAIGIKLSTVAIETAQMSYSILDKNYALFVVDKIDYAANKLAIDSQLASAEKVLSMCKAGLGYAIGIMLIAIGVSIYMGYYDYMNPDYKVVPRAIVDQRTETVYNSYGEEVGTKDFYYAYYPVEDANPDGEHGSYADMNGWKAQQWNVMYYTRDSRAGQPILAGTFVVQYGDSKKPEGYTAFGEFGIDAAADLNKHAFKEVQGIYLFYKAETQGSAANTLASVFSSGPYAIIAIAGLVVGAGAVLGIGAIINKKRRKKDIPVEA